jgi:hypothetical protein
MTTPIPSFRILILLSLIMLISPVHGAINTISTGDTVFIGEQGLDIHTLMDGDTKIGWWASGAAISSSSPDATMLISSPSGFSVAPADFNTHYGTWYRLTPSGASNGSAFVVQDPQISLRIEDVTVAVDVTDKWIPTDDEIKFRLETNLVPISQRSGVSSVPVTIKVQSPDGGIFTSLLNREGTAISIVDIPVTSTPFYPNVIWNTSKRETYPPGTYTIWADCNVNSMKDNYDQAGKTTSQKVSLLNQDQNPLIRGNYPTATTVPVTSKITTSIQTPLPTLSTPHPSVTPTPAVTTAVPISPSATSPLVSAIPTPRPTRSPGFEGIFAGVALLLVLIGLCPRN